MYIYIHIHIHKAEDDIINRKNEENSISLQDVVFRSLFLALFS